jgi:uncharacterized ion transporter superfamily protein YfcC
MAESSQTSHPNNQEDKQEKSRKVKLRLIWLGIALAIFGVIDVGYLIYRIAHPPL